MPATRGVKRTASKSAASAASSGPKNKKKRNVVQLEVPTLPKRRGRVLACGQGDVGQLGLGPDVVETNRFKHVTGLGEKIVDVCAGGMHTIALDSDGKVWTFGCNDEGALGRPTSGEEEEGCPKPVSLPAPCVSVSSGDSHSAALLHNGDVYAWGSFRDSHGSMGLVVRGREGKPCRDPVKLELPEPAAAIASGCDHLVILTTSGSVYTMGCGEQGQLGRLAQRSATRDTRQGFSALLVPSKVTLKGGASSIWAGYHATVVLDTSGDKVFAWGLNNYGQLGITGEKRKTAVFSPVFADAFTVNAGWRQVACGQHHSLALDNSGQVHAVGRCEYGRLGLGDRSTDAESLEPVAKLQNKKVVSIAAGTSNSFAVTDAGEIFSWGMGSEGQLSTGGSSDAAEPTPAVSAALAGTVPVHVTAGGQHTVLLVTDPNAKHEPSPAPEAETEEQKTEEAEEEEEPEPVEKKPKGRANKRQKKQEQEEEVSSTSSALASDVTADSAPQKVNGDEKKETPMEVDETDSKADKQEETKASEEHKETDKKDAKTDPEQDTDTSSQDTTLSEPANITQQDVEMKETDDTQDPKNDSQDPKHGSQDPKNSSQDPKNESEDSKMAEVNGSPEESKLEVKTVGSIQSEQAVVSSA